MYYSLIFAHVQPKMKKYSKIYDFLPRFLRYEIIQLTSMSIWNFPHSYCDKKQFLGKLHRSDKKQFQGKLHRSQLLGF